MRNLLFRKSKDNRGIALVSVMIVMTVVMLMATLIVELAYTSLLSRRVNTNSTKNFYAAQSALDDMSNVLQSIAIYSAKKYDDSTDFSSDFLSITANAIQNAATQANGGTSVTIGYNGQIKDLNVSKAISKFFFNNLDPQVQKVLGTDTNGDGVYEYDPAKLLVTAAMKNTTNGTKSQGSLTFTIEMNYEDESGYMTNISTDLVINNVVNRPPASAYSLASYSMFSGGGAVIYGENDLGDNHSEQYDTQGNVVGDHMYYPAYIQEGNAYIGLMDGSTTALDLYRTGLIFEGNRVIINGDAVLHDYAVLSFPGGSSQNGDKTIIDIRGTLYIDSTSALVLGKGVDLLVNDIRISKSKANQGTAWKSSAKSVFSSGITDQFAKADEKSFPNISNWPYRESMETMKDRDWQNLNKDAHIVDQFSPSKNSTISTTNKTSGCIVYTDGRNSYVVACKFASTDSSGVKKYSWHQVNGSGTSTSFGTEVSTFNLNRDDNFGPIAKATFFGFDGSTHAVDSELSNFVNLDILYYQTSLAENMINKDFGYNLVPSKDITRNNSVLCEINSPGYTFKDVTLVPGYNTGNYSKTNTFASNTELTFGDFKRKGVTFLMGKTKSVHHNDITKILWSNQWNSVPIHTPNGSFMGTVVTAGKTPFQKNGNGVSVGYSLLHGNETSLKTLINELKYVNFLNPSEVNFGGNGKKYVGKSDQDNLYGLGMLDSVYKGGLKSFCETVSDPGAGGPVEFDVSSMYDFITIENWKTN